MTTAEPSITVVGLGPGPWKYLTVEAAEVIQSASTLYVRTRKHPTSGALSSHFPTMRLQTFDTLFDQCDSIEAVDGQIVDAVIASAASSSTVVYGVPGSPSAGDAHIRHLLDRAASARVSVRLVEGMSVVEPILRAIDLPNTTWLQVFHASELALLSREDAVGRVPDTEQRLAWRAPIATAPIVVTGMFDREIAVGVRTWLTKFYPLHHTGTLVRTSAGTLTWQSISLSELDSIDNLDATTGVYVPAISETDNVRTFAGLMQLTRTLRAPGGCPWDREQTHATLKPHLLEEAYEVVEALDSGDPTLIVEELGDLLFQVTIHSQVAAENGTFAVEDVIEGIMRKLIGRHPHVFGEMELRDSHEVLRNWEIFKQREKPERASILEQIPRGMPALPQSNLMQKRARSVGFEWPNLGEVIAKVEEEIAELRMEIDTAESKDRQRDEFGDILFALVSVARHLRIDPEEALRAANRKFATRFSHVESRVKADGKILRELPPDELDRYWQLAKSYLQSGLSK